jgi:hypothetical protein
MLKTSWGILIVALGLLFGLLALPTEYKWLIPNGIAAIVICCLGVLAAEIRERKAARSRELSSQLSSPTLTGMEKDGHHVLLKCASQTNDGQSGTMLRISMLNTGVKPLLGCRAIIDGVKRNGVSYFNEQLMLGGYNKPLLADQTFQLGGREEGFLDVFFVRMSTLPLFYLPYGKPASLPNTSLNPGTYILKIVLSGHDFSPITENFEFKWDGDINSAALVKV